MQTPDASPNPFPRPLLAPFAGLALITGLAYLLGSPDRTRPASFAIAKMVASMHVWGIAFLIGAGALATVIALDHKYAIVTALFVGGLLYTWWGLSFGIAALNDPRASANAWATYMFIGFTHYLAAWRIAVWRR